MVDGWCLEGRCTRDVQYGFGALSRRAITWDRSESLGGDGKKGEYHQHTACFPFVLIAQRLFPYSVLIPAPLPCPILSHPIDRCAAPMQPSSISQLMHNTKTNGVSQIYK